jgi:hypothetical protein
MTERLLWLKKQKVVKKISKTIASVERLPV